MAKQVSTTYGSALFEVALENNTLDATLEEVLLVKQTFLENEELTKFLFHPNIEKQEKVNVIKNVYQGKVSDELMGLMTMMVEKDRQRDMISVFDYVIGAIKKEKGIGVAYISSAIALSEEQKKKIEQKLLDTSEYQQIEGNYQVDESLIGGLVIKLQDTVVDSSLKTQIANLSKSLL